MPEAVVIDEALRSVAVRFFDGNVVDIRASVFDCDDLVVPVLLQEPAMLGQIALKRVSLPLQSETDALRENFRRFAGNVNMPAAILMRAAPGENAEIQEQKLNRLAHFAAGGRENDALLARVSITVEVGSQ